MPYRVVIIVHLWELFAISGKIYDNSQSELRVINSIEKIAATTEDLVCVVAM
jgi:hypothetical protein